MNAPEPQQQRTTAEPQDPLASHTLVIPTYNRSALLSRLAGYCARQAPPMRVLVLDSSKPEVASENARMLAPHRHVRHIVFPSTMPMAAKLCRGLADVETPTVSFCADDDLVFPDGVREALRFLSGHADHVSAHGLYLNFREQDHEVHVMREYAGQSNDAANPGARIFRLCQSYESLFYGAFRTEELREVFAGVVGLPTLHYQELFQSVAALIKGKVHRFPRFYAARRSGPAAEPERDKWQTYYWFADNPTEFFQHYLAYREHVWLFYQSHYAEPRFDQDTFCKILDVSHAIYFSKGCPPAYFHSVLQQHWPGDEFVDKPADLFQVIHPPPSLREPGRAERLLFKALRRLRGWRGPRAGVMRAEQARLALDREIQSLCRSPWTCQLPLGLKWLPQSEEFRVAYRELCIYLDAPPQNGATA